MALSGSIQVNIAATLAKALDLQTVSAPLSMAYSWTIASGTAANQADKLFADTRSTAGTDSLDMAGSLLDAAGDAFTPLRIKGLAIKAAGANTGDLRLSRPSAGVPLLGATGDFITIRPGGLLLWVAPDATGIAVTPTTADLIDIVSASGTNAYDIAIIGASA